MVLDQEREKKNNQTDLSYAWIDTPEPKVLGATSTYGASNCWK